MSGLDETMRELSALAEDWLDRRYAVPACPEQRLHEAMRYSVTGGGKRLRPVLSLAVCDMLGGDRGRVLPFACALESIHAYSLVHDDLPAMDNDDLRRGRPTNHKVFGEAMAILAGDALLNRAFEILFGEILAQACDPLCVEAAALVAEAAGANGMIGGQTVDMEAEGRQIPLESLRHMHRLKTGAIIRAAALLAAILCGAEALERAAIDRYAEAVGMAFQIKDDLLDIQSTTEVLGKPVGSDDRNGKSTYAGLLGIDGAQRELERTVADAIEALAPFGRRADFLCGLARWIGSRSH